MHGFAEHDTFLGRYEEAEKLNRDALEIQRRVLKRDHPDIAETLIRLTN